MKRYISLLLLLFSCHGWSATQIFQSPQQGTRVVELYSSQGCSSCPPAERWISTLLDHPDLWTGIIPMVFHVDYWNYLGWSDIYSQAQFTRRQRDFQKHTSLRSVYTPGFIVNGREWRGWYLNQKIPQHHTNGASLRASLDKHKLDVTYAEQGRYNLHIAVLGFGLSTRVTHGENTGRTLHEDFVVLKKFSAWSERSQWSLPLTLNGVAKAKRYALVLWVSQYDSPEPVQAAGGWLNM